MYTFHSCNHDYQENATEISWKMMPSVFALFRNVKCSKSAVPMFAAIAAVWRPATSTLRARKGPWACQRRRPVTSSCALSRAPSAKSGTASPCASAATAARESPTSPAPQMGWPTTTSATWMQKRAPKASPYRWWCAASTSPGPTLVPSRQAPPHCPPPRCSAPHL